MKKFFLEQSDDKKHHLFVWDSATGQMSLLAVSDFAKQIDFSSFIIKNEKESYNVFTLSEGCIEKIVVPNTNIEIYNKCFIWQDEGVWFGCHTQNDIVRLGERFAARMSITACVMCDTNKWLYFIDEQDDEIMYLTFIRKNGFYRCGPYKKLEHGYAEKLIAYKDDIYCDIYIPYSPYLEYPKKDDKSFSSFFMPDKAFYWQEKERAWLCMGKGVALAANAFQEHYLKDDKPYARLYEVVGKEKKLVAEGRFDATRNGDKYDDHHFIVTCVDGFLYPYRESDRKIDFSNPKPILSRKLKKIFTGK